jgi:hypothetical protein
VTLKRTLLGLGLASIVALLIFNFVFDRLPVGGDPHRREDGTLRVIAKAKSGPDAERCCVI